MKQTLKQPHFEDVTKMIREKNTTRNEFIRPDFGDISEINRKAAEKRFLWVHGGIDRMPVKGDTRGAFGILIAMAIAVVILGIILGS
jgi:hypothetical protein